MAIYHMRVKIFSRSKKHSAVAAAAYRAGIELVDVMAGTTHNYLRRKGVLETRCFAPHGAPEWATQPDKLWHEVRMREKRKDSQEAREFEIALPRELSDEQRCDLSWDICRALVDRYQIAIQASIHEPPTHGGDNWHLHALATMRRVRPEGLTDKTRELDGGAIGKAEVEWVREMIAERTNRQLALAGHAARVDHRTLGDQMLSALEDGDTERAAELATRKATRPMGKNATAMARRGMANEIADDNDAIRAGNARRRAALRRKLVEDGHLAAPSEGHSHAQALRDRQREAISLGNGSGSIGSVTGLGSFSGPQTPYDRQQAKQANTRTHFAEAARLWAEDFVATIDLAFKATRMLLAHQADRAAAFAHLPTFRSDVRAFLTLLKRLKNDALRFRRRMEAQDRAAHLDAHAKGELARFDEQHPHPGLWTKRQWQMRRARRLQSVMQHEQAHKEATQATAPDAQVSYARQAMETGEQLEQLSAVMLTRYPVGQDLAPQPQPAPVPAAQAAVQPARGPRM